MNFDWSVFNYKVVALFKTFSNDKSQVYMKMNMKMIVITKRFETWLFLEELEPFPWESTLLPREVVLLLEKRGPFPKENKLFLMEVTLFLGNLGLSLEKIQYSLRNFSFSLCKLLCVIFHLFLQIFFVF